MAPPAPPAWRDSYARYVPSEDDSYDRPKRLRSEDKGEWWAQQEFHLLASQLYRHLLY